MVSGCFFLCFDEPTMPCSMQTVSNCWLTGLKQKWEQDFNSLPLQPRWFLLHPEVCPQLASISFVPLPSEKIKNISTLFQA